MINLIKDPLKPSLKMENTLITIMLYRRIQLNTGPKGHNAQLSLAQGKAFISHEINFDIV